MVTSTAQASARTGGSALSCRGVTKSYGRGAAAVAALRGVDLDVFPGELLMLAGPSGCGKTTLISVLAGLIPRDAGQCTVLGRDYRTMSAAETTDFRGRNIGFVFQAFNLIPALDAAENAAAPLVINGVPRRTALGRARELLRGVGFDERMLRSRPWELSYGQQQRVAIARAMIHAPHVIVCDEPTSALDSRDGHLVMELLRRVALAPDRALIVVTHDARILPVADRIARMEDGRITRIEGPLEASAAPREDA